MIAEARHIRVGSSSSLVLKQFLEKLPKDREGQEKWRG